MSIKKASSCSDLNNFNYSQTMKILKNPLNEENYTIKTHSLPNISRINHGLNELIFNYALNEAVSNLNHTSLDSLLKIPLTIKNDLIIDIMIKLMFCTFSPRVIRESFQYKRKFASLTFEVLIKRSPRNAYPLIETLIGENLWHTYDEQGFKIIWPLTFLSILLDQGYNLVKTNNLLLALSKNYINQNQIELSSGLVTYYLYEQDYQELRKIILGFYKNDENFGSKILPGVDLVAFEERIKSSSFLFYHMQISIKVNIYQIILLS